MLSSRTQLQEIIPLSNFQVFSAVPVTWFNGFQIKNVMVSKRMVEAFLEFQKFALTKTGLQKHDLPVHGKLQQHNVTHCFESPPDLGLAPTALWKAPPQSPPLQLFPPSSPHPPGSFCNAPGRGGPRLAWGRGPRAQEGGGGGPSNLVSCGGCGREIARLRRLAAVAAASFLRFWRWPQKSRAASVFWEVLKGTCPKGTLEFY